MTKGPFKAEGFPQRVAEEGVGEMRSLEGFHCRGLRAALGAEKALWPAPSKDTGAQLCSYKALNGTNSLHGPGSSFSRVFSSGPAPQTLGIGPERE